jgi:sigma-B regulation protein RsbU (phosphoserine phosphatase)
MERAQAEVMRGILRERREKLQQTITRSSDTGQLIQLLHEVDAALDRIDAGSYGICELCSGEIEEEYLRADPIARICLAHLNEEQQHAIERDLSLASSIQGKLLPTAVTHLPGWDIVHRYQPLGPVSGDFCDILPSATDPVEGFFLFGDVSGKGVSASLLMSHLHAIFRSLAGTDMSLARVVERANRLFCEGTMSLHYATLVWGRLDDRGRLEICNAGHCPPLLIRASGVTSIDATGLPVGLFYSAEYETHQEQLDSGDTLLLYTDGLTETHDSAENEYGDARLSSLVAQTGRSLPLDQLLDVCLNDAASFRGNAPRTDDLTVMAIRRTG